MKVLIVEDELLAEQTLRRALFRNFRDVEVIGVTRSVKSTVEWIQDHGKEVDVVFMDVELQDGSSFQVFGQVQIAAPVIITTAYSKYGISAFEVGSIDYLMKPITDAALLRAVNRARSLKTPTDKDLLVSAMKEFIQSRDNENKLYKRRYVLHSGQKIIPVETNDIAYFYLEGKSKYLVKRNGLRYFIDHRLENILDELNPSEFFRISRNYIVSIHVIEDIERLPGGRLKIALNPPPEEDVIVARARVRDFLEWIS